MRNNFRRSLNLLYKIFRRLGCGSRKKKGKGGQPLQPRRLDSENRQPALISCRRSKAELCVQVGSQAGAWEPDKQNIAARLNLRLGYGKPCPSSKITCLTATCISSWRRRLERESRRRTIGCKKGKAELGGQGGSQVGSLGTRIILFSVFGFLLKRKLSVSYTENLFH